MDHLFGVPSLSQPFELDKMKTNFGVDFLSRLVQNFIAENPFEMIFFFVSLLNIQMQTKEESMIVICTAYAKNRLRKADSMSESERVTLRTEL